MLQKSVKLSIGDHKSQIKLVESIFEEMLRRVHTEDSRSFVTVDIDDLLLHQSLKGASLRIIT